MILEVIAWCRYEGTWIIEVRDIREDDTHYNTPGGTVERALHSWLGRLGYSYMDKYYVEVSGAHR